MGTNPFRLGDFAGYVNGVNGNSYVNPMINFTVGPDAAWTSDVDYITQLFFTLNDNRGSSSLDITDFGTNTNALKDWYVGAILIKNSDEISSTTCRSYYSYNKKLTDLSDGGFDCYDNFRFGLPPEVFMHSNAPKYGIYTIYLALFQNANRYGSSNANITTSDGSYFIPLPIKPVTFTLNKELATQENLSITMNDLYTEGSSIKTIKASVTITNKNSTAWSFKYDTANASGFYFIRVRTTRQYDDDYDSFGNANTATTVTVAANSSSTFEVQSNYSYVSGGYYTVYVDMCFMDGNGNIT